MRYRIEYLTAAPNVAVCSVVTFDSSLAGAVLHARVGGSEARIHHRAVSFLVRDELRRGSVVASEELRGF